MPHTRSLATLALLVFATLPMTGCVYYRTLFKPDKQAEIELEKRKKESAKYGAKIVWEDQEFGLFPKPEDAGGEAGTRAEHPVSDIIVWAGVGLILPLLLVGLLVWR